MTDRDWNELRNEFHQTTDAMIKRSGRSIIAVFDCEGDDQPFAYTIGNHLKGLPELLVIGGRRDEVVGLLNGLSEMMIKADMVFKDGQVVRISCGFPFKLIRARNIARTEYAVQAGEHFGHDDYPSCRSCYRTRKAGFPAMMAAGSHIRRFLFCAWSDAYA